LLQCLNHKFAASHQLRQRTEQIKNSQVGPVFTIVDRRLEWNPAHFPPSRDEINRIVEFFIGQYSEKDQRFKLAVQRLCSRYFHELPVIRQFIASARSASIAEVAGLSVLPGERAPWAARRMMQRNGGLRQFIRDALAFVSHPHPGETFNPSALHLMIERSLHLRQIRTQAELQGTRLGNVAISTEITGIFNKFAQIFQKSTNRQINNFSDRFSQFNREVEQTFIQSLGALGQNAERALIDKVQSSWRTAFEHAKQTFARKQAQLANPFASPLAQQRHETVLLAIQQAYSSEYSSMLADAMHSFEHAFIDALYHSAHTLNLPRAVAGKNSGHYEVYLQRWSASFAELRQNFALLHERMQEEVLGRGQSIGCDAQQMLAALAARHSAAQQRLAVLMFSAYQGHVDQLIGAYCGKIEDTRKRSTQEEARLLVLRAVHYWKVISGAFDVFALHGVQAEDIARIKLEKLDAFEALVLHKYAADTKVAMNLRYRFKEAFYRPGATLVGALGVTGVAVGAGLALFASASGVGGAFILLTTVGGCGYFIYTGGHAMSKHFSIRKQQRQLHIFFHETRAHLNKMAAPVCARRPQAIPWLRRAFGGMPA